MEGSLKKIKFGILGRSRVAEKNMIPALLSSRFAELFILGSRNSEKTYDDVISDKQVDAIYISLPNSMHEEWAVKALNAGKHVLCEKPAAISYGAAKNMAEAAKKNNVRIMEGFMFRFHPQHGKVREFIKEGSFGDLLRFEGVFGYPSPDGENIRMKKELAGGSFFDAMPYPVYASRMLFGEEPLSVYCKLHIDQKSGVDRRADIILTYPGGKTAHASSIFGSYFQSKYSLLGEKGVVRAERAYAIPRDRPAKIILETNDQANSFNVEPADHFRLMIDEFAEEILTGKIKNKFEADLLAQARCLEAALLSNKEKREVEISEII